MITIGLQLLIEIGGANALPISFSAYLIGNNKYNFAHNVMCY